MSWQRLLAFIFFMQYAVVAKAQSSLSIYEFLNCSAAKFSALNSQKQIEADFGVDQKQAQNGFELSSQIVQSDTGGNQPTTASIMVSRTLYSPTLAAGIDAAKKMRDSIFFELQGELLNHLLEANNQVFTYLTLKSDRDFNDAQLAELSDMRNSVAKLTRLNVLDQSELLLLDDNLQKMKISVKRQDFETKRSLNALYLLSDINVNELNEGIKSTPLSEQDFLARTESYSFVKSGRLELEAIKYDLGSKNRSWWPSISASVGGQQQIYSKSGASSAFLPSISLSLAIDLNFDAVQAEINRAQQSLRRSEFQLAHKMKTFNVQVKQLFGEIKNLEEQRKLTEQRRDNLQNLYQTQVAKFKLGRLSFFNLRDTENSLFDTKRELSHLNLQIQKIQSFLTLYQIVLEAKKGLNFKCSTRLQAKNAD